MPEQLTYLGLLNGIVAGESEAHAYLQVWADATADPVLEAKLRTVAWREGEHALTFARRINELGGEVRPIDDALGRAVEDLRQIVCAQIPAAAP